MLGEELLVELDGILDLIVLYDFFKFLLKIREKPDAPSLFVVFLLLLIVIFIFFILSVLIIFKVNLFISVKEVVLFL